LNLHDEIISRLIGFFYYLQKYRLNSSGRLQHAVYKPPESSYAQTASGVTEKLQLIIIFVSGNVVNLNLSCSIPKCLYNKRRWRSVKHNTTASAWRRSNSCAVTKHN